MPVLLIQIKMCLFILVFHAPHSPCLSVWSLAVWLGCIFYPMASCLSMAPPFMPVCLPSGGGIQVRTQFRFSDSVSCWFIGCGASTNQLIDLHSPLGQTGLLSVYLPAKLSLYLPAKLSLCLSSKMSDYVPGRRAFLTKPAFHTRERQRERVEDLKVDQDLAYIWPEMIRKIDLTVSILPVMLHGILWELWAVPLPLKCTTNENQT